MMPTEQQVFPKDAEEELTLGYDFSPEMSANDAIIVGSSSVKVLDPDENDVTADLVDVSTLEVNGSTILQALFKGGEPGTVYLVKFKAYVSDSFKPVGRFYIAILPKV